MMRIGVIGGLGPLATAKFMELVDRKIGEDSISMVVINDPTTPDRTSFILDNNNDNPLDSILNMVKKLELFDVDLIVMPCNTASYFYKEIINNTSILFINIVQETVNYLSDLGVKKVGLLATCGTVKSNIYYDLLKEKGITCVTPSDSEQDIISSCIYDGVKCNKKVDLNEFLKVCNGLIDKGCERIIFGCTELSALMINEKLDNPVFLDAMDVLASKTVSFIK